MDVSPVWTGDLDVFDQAVKVIEVVVSITNRSKKSLKIDRLNLRIRDCKLLVPFYKELQIEACNCYLNSNSKLEFRYNIRPVFDSYGCNKKFRFRVVSGDVLINSRLISLKSIQDALAKIYTRHF